MIIVIPLILLIVLAYLKLSKTYCDATKKLGHNWAKWKQPYSTSSYQKRECKDCGFVQEKDI